MADTLEFDIQPREGRGSSKARQLRRQGLVPGVLYGHKEAAQSITLPAEVVEHALRHGARVVGIKGGKAFRKAQIKEVQWDHLGKEILHVDLVRVAENERIKVQVPLEVKGIAPGVTAGGVLDQPIHVIEVECLVSAVPTSIRVNVNELQLGQAIHVRDLHLPPDVKALADPDAIVIHVTAPQAEPEPTAVPVAESAEPEVIGRKATEEEEAE
jgi:large subunit ribosomal protein L25